MHFSMSRVNFGKSLFLSVLFLFCAAPAMAWNNSGQNFFL